MTNRRQTPRKPRAAAAVAIGALLALAAVAAAQGNAPAPAGGPAAGAHHGIFSLLPAAVAVLLCFLTKEVVSALFLGIVSGALVNGVAAWRAAAPGDPFPWPEFNLLDRYLYPAVGSKDFALILVVYLWCLGGLIGIWNRTGAAELFADRLGRRMVRGRRSAMFCAWVTGCVFFQGGTISTILTGTTIRPLTDKHRVSHEELSYIVDSTASPIASLLAFNAWPLYIAGCVAGSVPALFPDQAAGLMFFWKALPFNFYSILAVLGTLLLSFEFAPFVGKRMREAIRRVKETGELDRPGSRPLASAELMTVKVPEGYRPHLADFVVPLAVLIGLTVGPVAWHFGSGRAGKPPNWIAEAFGLALLSAMGLALLRGMKLTTVIEGFVDGCKGVTLGGIILALAVTMGAVTKNLGAGAYVVQVAQEHISPVLLPVLLQGLCMVIAFSTGTSWGTYAIVFPLAMPLAYGLNPDPTYVAICFAAVVGGSVYGDQCSPISDTCVLSAVACGADLMDHVQTQLPQATIAAGIAAALSTAAAAFLV